MCFCQTSNVFINESSLDNLVRAYEYILCFGTYVSNKIEGHMSWIKCQRELAIKSLLFCNKRHMLWFLDSPDMH